MSASRVGPGQPPPQPAPTAIAARRSRFVLDRNIPLDIAADIARSRVAVGLDERAVSRCRAAAGRLSGLIAENRRVYGITTGFGPLAGRTVTVGETPELQQKLVYHLASGVGPLLPWDAARAMVLARLVSIVQGASGASEATVAMLLAVLNSDLAPAVPSRGTVGASGDLTPLAHMVLALQGKATFINRQGCHVAGSESLEAIGQAPLTLEARDGLALVNGTSAMTGIAVLSAVDARTSLAWGVALSAGLLEVLGGHAEAWDVAFAKLRPHPGQLRVTEALLARLDGASLPRTSLACEDRVCVSSGEAAAPHQDAYTLRCVPQVLGAVADVLDWHHTVVATELGSVTDNPVFPERGPAALHGGNFMGQHVALASDAATNAITVMAGLAERQIARLTDEKLNGGLPAFLHGGRAGLDSGLMGAQVTATALLAELRAYGASVSSQSISTNGANQDVVSLGTIAARRTRDGLETCGRIQAILAIAVAAALDFVESREGSDHAVISPAARSMRTFVRRHSAPLGPDRPLGAEIEALSDAMAASMPPGGNT